MTTNHHDVDILHFLIHIYKSKLYEQFRLFNHDVVKQLIYAIKLSA